MHEEAERGQIQTFGHVKDRQAVKQKVVQQLSQCQRTNLGFWESRFAKYSASDGDESQNTMLTLNAQSVLIKTWGKDGRVF